MAPPNQPNNGVPHGEDEDLVAIYVLVKEYREGKKHGKLILHFEGGNLTRATEEKSTVFPKRKEGR